MNQVRPFQNQQLHQMEQWAGTYEPSDTLSKPTIKMKDWAGTYLWTKRDPCKTNN